MFFKVARQWLKLARHVAQTGSTVVKSGSTRIFENEHEVLDAMMGATVHVSQRTPVHHNMSNFLISNATRFPHRDASWLSTRGLKSLQVARRGNM